MNTYIDDKQVLNEGVINYVELDAEVEKLCQYYEQQYAGIPSKELLHPSPEDLAAKEAAKQLALAARAEARRKRAEEEAIAQAKREEEAKELVATHCTSDTLVLHLNDPSTTMLRQIYEGKGWDVINSPIYPSVRDIVAIPLIEKHKRIVMLGHGSPYGLIGMIGPEQAEALADKDLFVIWCNADVYFDRYLPDKHGFFCTGNMPSDAREAAWVGCRVSEPYMNDNITYWCKLCGDVCEQALDGDAQGAVDYVRDHYWEKYGEGYDVDNLPADIPDTVKITKYNYDRTKVQ